MVKERDCGYDGCFMFLFVVAFLVVVVKTSLTLGDLLVRVQALEDAAR